MPSIILRLSIALFRSAFLPFIHSSMMALNSEFEISS